MDGSEFPAGAQNDAKKSFTLRLSKKALADLKWISDHYGGISITEVLRRAVATEKLLLENQISGNELIIEDSETKRQKILTLR